MRVGRYDTESGAWTFAYYPLEVRLSPNGGWVGLSEITALRNGQFAVVERDNQANTDARIKRIYRFSPNGVTFKAEGQAFETLSKQLVRNLLPSLRATGGLVLEKVEGLTVTSRGAFINVTDNDGVEDSSRETQLIRIR